MSHMKNLRKGGLRWPDNEPEERKFEMSHLKNLRKGGLR